MEGIPLPVMPPFQPAMNASHAEMLDRHYAEHDVGFEEYNVTVDDSFWPVFCEQADMCPDAHVEPLAEIENLKYQQRETVNRQWMRAYVKALEELYPLNMTVTNPSQGTTESFKANDAFWEICMGNKGQGIDDGSPVLQVQAGSNCKRVTLARVSISWNVWCEIVNEWNRLYSYAHGSTGSAKKKTGRRLGAHPVSYGDSEYDELSVFDDGHVSPCGCENHSPMRQHGSLGWQLASVFQSQRKLHYGLLSQNATSVEQAVRDLDMLGSSEKVADLLHLSFPLVSRNELNMQRDHYLNLLLECPQLRGRAGSRKPLPAFWPCPEQRPN
eukprot:TRINITY_DN43261_c0_g1_i1.p1 TRINITY_DN43261_c0_g1~~TRINITY_DN43261_c0_g1_i1.p1  ORF type:complete len:340 (+),score=87.18 TRINITY_DN43261_c0_g1_i1:42-1022(+)